MAEGSTRAFDHGVRVIICDECGAPLPVPVEGGAVGCQYCSASYSLAARVEPPLRAYRSIGLDEAKRLETLRKQDVEPFMAPPGLAPLVFAGSLRPGKIGEAEAAFRAVRKQAAAVGSRESESALLFLVRLMMNHYLHQRDNPRLRATLEAALEVARSSRARQMLYAMLARAAARAGDLVAANDWLAPCDPAAQHLGMDTDYRVARAYLATASGDHRAVLDVLGRRLGEVPIQDTTECFAAVLRANALEQLEGVDAAAAELRAACSRDSLFVVEACIFNNPDLRLCRQSLPVVRRRLSLPRKSLAFGPVVAFSLFFVLIGTLLFGTVEALASGPLPIGTAGQIAALLLSVLALPTLLTVARLRITEYRRKRSSKSRAHAMRSAP